MKAIHILIASVAALSFAATSTAAPFQGGFGSPQRGGQRNETPPDWSVGTWTGYNDNLRADIELKIDKDGRATLLIRRASGNRTLKGSFRDGKLDFDGERYLIRQSGRDLGLTRDSNRADAVILRNQDGRPVNHAVNDLSITEPRNNERVKAGTVYIRGETSSPEVQIELRRGRDILQNPTAGSRGGNFEFRFNLTPGKYEATVRAKDRGRTTIERKVVFNVGGMGKTYIENPRAGEKLDSGPVTISGTSEAPDVEVEVYRGRDRVFIEQIRVRDGRFTSRTNLAWGTYVVTVRGKEDGEVLGTDKRGFEVIDNRPGPGWRDLKVEKPSARGRYRAPSVDFEGTAGGSLVRIQISRGRDQVVNQTADVRDGRFRARIKLDRGHYEATITSEERGRVTATQRLSFDVE